MEIILIILAVIVLWLVFTYNSLVQLRVRVKEAWSDIDVQLKRRYDLIPNLIETVKGYAKHERETLDAVIQARSKATAVHVDPSKLDAGALQAMAQAETGLTQALGKLFALSENYPDLKANQNFAKLQDELTDTENKIQAARRFYNSNVTEINTKVQTVPANIVANMFGFKQETFFEIEDETERKNVKVSF
jgi:LemA protein